MEVAGISSEAARAQTWGEGALGRDLFCCPLGSQASVHPMPRASWALSFLPHTLMFSSAPGITKKRGLSSEPRLSGPWDQPVPRLLLQEGCWPLSPQALRLESGESQEGQRLGWARVAAPSSTRQPCLVG